MWCGWARGRGVNNMDGMGAGCVPSALRQCSGNSWVKYIPGPVKAGRSVRYAMDAPGLRRRVPAGAEHEEHGKRSSTTGKTNYRKTWIPVYRSAFQVCGVGLTCKLSCLREIKTLRNLGA